MVAPAPRESDPQGMRLQVRRVGPLHFQDFVGLFCQPEGQGPRGRFIWGGGALSTPSGPFFTRTFLCSRPRFFFGLRGPDWIARRCCVYIYIYIYISLSCSENVFQEWNVEFQDLFRECPGTLRELRQKSSPSPGPPPSSDLIWDEEEMLSAF